MLRAIVLSAVLVGCANGGGGDDDDDDDSAADIEHARQACRDVADTFADSWERCEPGTYEQAYDAMIQAANGDCDNVVDVRDMYELYNSCIPWIEDVDCAYLESDGFELDTSCLGQLLRAS